MLSPGLKVPIIVKKKPSFVKKEASVDSSPSIIAVTETKPIQTLEHKNYLVNETTYPSRVKNISFRGSRAKFYNTSEPGIIVYTDNNELAMRMKLYYQTLFNYQIILVNNNNITVTGTQLYLSIQTNLKRKRDIGEIVNYFASTYCKEDKKVYGFTDIIPYQKAIAIVNSNQNTIYHNLAATKLDNKTIKYLPEEWQPSSVNINLNSNQIKLLKVLQETHNKINQVSVSRCLSRFENKICKEYDLSKYAFRNDPAIFFGCYNHADFTKLKSHKAMAILVWGGTDVNTIDSKNFMDKKIFFRENIYHVAISDQISSKLLEIGIPKSKIRSIHLRLLNYKDYNEATPLKDSVYIYTSLDSDRAKNIYGSDVYREVIGKLPDINFIIAHGQYSQQEIIDVYKRCFIGLRLTFFDGSANTVQELGLLGRKCVHNGDMPTSLRWSTAQDVINHINHERKMVNRVNLMCRRSMLEFLSSDDTWLFADSYRGSD